jgi:hypothetical protein
MIHAIGVAVGRCANVDNNLIIDVERALRTMTLNLNIQQALKFELGQCRAWPGGQGIEAMAMTTNAATEIAVVNNGRPSMKSIRRLEQPIALTPGNSFETWYNASDSWTPVTTFSLDTYFYGKKVSRQSV